MYIFPITDTIKEGIMGTIVFLVLRLAFGYNAVGDGQTLATLVSLDSIALILLLKLKSRKAE